MTTADPANHVYWLASRALGVVALVLISAAVGLGLALSSKAVRYPGAPAWLKHLHEAISLTALGALVGHGLLLIGDSYLNPGVAGIALPFQMTNQPIWTGLGIIAGWLALILGLSFYVRRWIGVAVWRWLHRWTLAVYLLAVVHTLGSGTDTGALWLTLVMVASAAPIIFFGAHRLLPRAPKRATPVAAPRGLSATRPGV